MGGGASSLGKLFSSSEEPKRTRPVTISNGDVYKGRLKGCRRHGSGVYNHADGTVYDGAWRDDARHGHGTCSYACGDRYEGEWRNDVMHGHGKCTWAHNGSTWEGEWSSGLPAYVKAATEESPGALFCRHRGVWVQPAAEDESFAPRGVCDSTAKTSPLPEEDEEEQPHGHSATPAPGSSGYGKRSPSKGEVGYSIVPAPDAVRYLQAVGETSRARASHEVEEEEPEEVSKAMVTGGSEAKGGGYAGAGGEENGDSRGQGGASPLAMTQNGLQGGEGWGREGIEGMAHQPTQGGSRGDAAAGGKMRAPVRGPEEEGRPGAHRKRRTLAPLPSRIHPAPPLPNEGGSPR